MASSLRDLLYKIKFNVDDSAVDEAERSTDGLTDSAEDALSAFDRLNDRMRKMSESANRIGSAMETGGREFAAPFLAGGAAIAGGLGLAVKTAADFEGSMSRVGALSGATNEELKAMTDTAAELGAKTSFSASQASEGMSYLAMAGYDANETIAAMPGLLSAAAAGQTDLGTTADITSNILSGFGLEAAETTRVADVLTKTFTSSNTTMEMLGQTMKYVAPIATASGQSLEGMASAAGILGNAGIQADQAGTSLRMMLIRLAKPPKMAQDALDELGISVADQNGNMKDLSQVIGEMNKATEGMAEADKLAAVSKIAGTEAASAMLALMEAGQGTMEDFTGELMNAGGTADDIANKQLDNLNGQLTILKSAVEGAGITIGNVMLPYIKSFVSGVQSLVDWFNNLPDSIQRTIVIATALTGALLLTLGAVGLLISFVGMVTLSFGHFLTGMANVGNFLAKFRILFTLLSGPIGLTVTALTILGLYLTHLYKTNETFRENVQKSWAAIQDAVSASVDWMIVKFGEMKSALDVAFDGVSAGIDWIVGKFDEFTDSVGGLGDEVKAVKDYFAESFDGISNTIATVSPLIARIGLGFLGMTGPVGWVIALIVSLASFFVKLYNTNETFRDGVINAFTAIQGAVGPVIGFIMDMAGQMFDIFLTILTPAAQEFATAWTELQPEFQKTGQVIMDSIRELGPAFAELGPAFSELFSVLGEMFSTFATTTLPLLATAFSQIFPILLELFGAWQQVIMTIITTVLPVLLDVVMMVFPVILQIIQAVIPIVIQIIMLIIPVILQIVQTVLPILLQVVMMVFPIILQVIQMVLPIVVMLLQMVAQIVVSIVIPAIQLIMQIVQLVFPIILQIIQAVIPIVTFLLQTVATIITNVVVPIIRGLLAVIQFIFPAIQLVIETVLTIILGVINAALSLLQGDWEGAWNVIKDTAETIWNNIVEFFQSLDLFQIGADMLQGLIDGIGSMAGAVVDAVSGVASNAWDSFTGFFGIQSPSRLMISGGMDVMKGAIIGVEDMQPDFTRTMSDAGTSGYAAFDPASGFRSAQQTMASGAPARSSGDTNTVNLEINLYGEATEEDGQRVATSVKDELEEFFGGMGRRYPTPQEL